MGSIPGLTPFDRADNPDIPAFTLASERTLHRHRLPIALKMRILVKIMDEGPPQTSRAILLSRYLTGY